MSTDHQHGGRAVVSLSKRTRGRNWARPAARVPVNSLSRWLAGRISSEQEAGREISFPPLLLAHMAAVQLAEVQRRDGYIPF